MPYDERSINELYESAEITPMGIQLEVNAEIFTTIYNLLSNMRSEEGIQQEDEKRLLHLWRKTVRAMAKVELRKGHGISMEKQIEMLKEAYAIETKYTADQLFFFRELLQTDKRRVGRSPTFFRRRDEYPFQLGYLACHDKGQNRGAGESDGLHYRRPARFRKDTDVLRDHR